MREYRIVAGNLGFILKKVYKEEEGVYTTVLYRNGRWWDFRKESAKEYLFKDDASGALIYARKYGGNESC